MTGTGEEIKAEGKLVIFQRAKTPRLSPVPLAFRPTFIPPPALTIQLCCKVPNFTTFFPPFRTVHLLFLPFVWTHPFPFSPFTGCLQPSFRNQLTLPFR